jgi:hypothetical protein
MLDACRCTTWEREIYGLRPSSWPKNCSLEQGFPWISEELFDEEMHGRMVLECCCEMNLCDAAQVVLKTEPACISILASAISAGNRSAEETMGSARYQGVLLSP